MRETPISNVSDTARWVAIYRAEESARPDALFHDQYARTLAGARGQAIADRIPGKLRSGWPMVARTKVIDDLVIAAVAAGCDCVVNLAAGLDTRPYRLDLPESLEWVEADLPAMIEEKTSVLGDARPRCRLRQIPVDLQDSAARGAALRSAVHGADRVLVITEGLLIYLDEAEVSRIAADLAALPEVESWITDIAAPAILRMMQKGLGSMLVNAPMKFAPANGVGFFEALGWRVVEVQSLFHAAARLRRLPLFLRLFALLPEPNPRKLEQARWSGVVWLTRTPR